MTGAASGGGGGPRQGPPVRRGPVWGWLRDLALPDRTAAQDSSYASFLTCKVGAVLDPLQGPAPF